MLKKKEVSWILGGGLFILFLITRLLFLDADLPPWGVINYQPADEGAYAMMALNKYNYGKISPEPLLGHVEYVTSQHVRTNIVGNILVYIGLLILGDNYWGFRIGSVLCGGVIFFLSGAIMKEIGRRNGMKEETVRGLTMAVLVYMLIDFPFLIASRTVETSLYRMLFVVLTIFVFFQVKDVFKKFMLMGGVIILSIFGVYVTNVFLGLALVITMAAYGLKYGKKVFFRALQGSIIGGGFVFIVLELYYLIVWDTFAIKNMFEAVFSFSNQAGYEITSSGKIFLQSTLKLIASNPNLYNIGIISVVLLSVPYILYVIIKKHNISVIFLSSILISFYLQTLVSEDYVIRKFIIVYPALIFLLAALFTNRKQLRSYMSRLGKAKKIVRCSVAFWSMVAGIICIFIPIYRLWIIKDGTTLDFKRNDRIILTVLTISAVMIVQVIFSLYFYKNSLPKWLLMGGMLVVSSMNIYMDCKYVFLNRSYTEKEAMKSIGETVGNGFVIGGFFPIGYTLYNDIKPIMTEMEDIPEIMEQYPDMWLLDYTDKGEGGVGGYLAGIFSESDYMPENKREFERNFPTFGLSRNIALYQVRLK